MTIGIIWDGLVLCPSVAEAGTHGREGIADVAGMTVNKHEFRDTSTDAVMQELKRAIEALKYGSITIKVHNGKIAQVEITEKRRFDMPIEFEKGGGI